MEKEVLLLLFSAKAGHKIGFDPPGSSLAYMRRLQTSSSTPISVVRGVGSLRVDWAGRAGQRRWEIAALLLLLLLSEMSAE